MHPDSQSRNSSYWCWRYRCCVDRCQPDLHKLDRCRTSPQPSPYGDQRANCLKQSERPRSLQEPIGGTEDAGRRERQDERSAAIFQSVADQHRRNRRQSEKGEGIHGGVHPTGTSSLSDRRVAVTYLTSLGSSRPLYCGASRPSLTPFFLSSSGKKRNVGGHRSCSCIRAATMTPETKVSSPMAAMVQAKPTIAASRPAVSAPIA